MLRERRHPSAGRGRPASRDGARPVTRHPRVRRALRPAPGGRPGAWPALAQGVATHPSAPLALLGLAMLLAFVAQGGMAERLRLTSRLANAYDRALSAGMPLAGLFRAAVAWVPHRLPAPLPGAGAPASPFLMAALGYGVVDALLFALYLLALARGARHPAAPEARSRRLLLIGGLGALFSAVLLFTPAAPSHDPFAYAMSGRLIATYHANPFFVVPAAYPHDPILAADDWRVSATAYGPLWSALSLSLASFVGADPLRANMVYRLVALVAHLLNIALIAALLRLLPPAYAAWRERGVLFYAWNPLVVIEVAAGHNDVVMLTVVLLGLYLLARGRPYAAAVALGGAILLKASAWPLVLVAFLGVWLAERPGAALARVPDQIHREGTEETEVRDGDLTPGPSPAGRGEPERASAGLAGARAALRAALAGRAIRALGAALGVVALGYLPFYLGHSPAAIAASGRIQPTNQALARALDSSFGTLAAELTGLGFLPAPVAGALARGARLLDIPAFWTLVLAAIWLAAALLVLPLLAHPDRRVAALAWIYALWMLFLGVFYLLRTWYLIPLVGLIALAPAARPMRRFTLALCATMELTTFLFISRAPPFGGWQAWTPLLVVGVPAALLAVALWRAGASWRAAARRSAALLHARLALPDASTPGAASCERVEATSPPAG